MAEKEYIEREAFREYWNKEFRHLYPNDKYLVALANFPAADVVEVRHGVWFWRDNHDKSYTLCCSVCHKTEGAREEATYCPNCGAKMNGVTDTNVGNKTDGKEKE